MKLLLCLAVCGLAALTPARSELVARDQETRAALAEFLAFAAAPAPSDRRIALPAPGGEASRDVIQKAAVSIRPVREDAPDR